MIITVLGGSPKGEQSVTMQYVKYLQKNFPQHEYSIQQISSRIAALERSVPEFEKAIEAVRRSDLVLWASPVYYMLVPAQYKRFIELAAERNAYGTFAGKYAAVLTTSIHFYDHTAQEYMRSICEDMGMKFAGALSLDMHDLLQYEGRQKVDIFWTGILEKALTGAACPALNTPVCANSGKYIPGPRRAPVETNGRTVVILHDSRDGSSNLAAMVDRLKGAFAHAHVFNIREINIAGGCIGCLQCADVNRCAYTGKDEYISLFEQRLMPADIIVFVGEVRDRFFSAEWKTFIDRMFYKNHTPTLAGKQFAVLASGPLSQTPVAREVLTAFVEIQRANLVDIVTDEPANLPALDGMLDGLASRLVSAAGQCAAGAETFRGKAGWKVFRDDIYDGMRVIFRNDHRTYKRLKLYDFPTRKYGKRIVNACLTLLMNIAPIRRWFMKNIRENMLRDYQKYVSA